MKVELLSGARIESTLRGLLDEHDELHWAVAWGTDNPLTAQLLSHSRKFRAVSFGLAFAQTDPKLVENLVGVRGSRVVTVFPGGTFHPKVFAFRTGTDVAAVVGSANFTRGGLGRNHEASLLLTGRVSERALADILAFTKRSFALGKPVTAELAARYRLGHGIASRKPKAPRDPLAAVPTAAVRGLTSPLVGLSWPEYARRVRKSDHHEPRKSLRLLRTAQKWFASVASFHDLSPPQRKALAGVIGEADKSLDRDLGQEWGWFGSMRGAGDFKNRIAENDRSLARAVDSIPRNGEVMREHYDRFAKLFVRAFARSHRTGGIRTASRLLAMKRPDTFLCVSNPNLRAAAKEMGFARSTLTLDTYWDRVVEVVRASEWYGADKPASRNGELWECRVAMLDAILYDPG